mmetsp:Transcript_14406/g.21751  ORF Transcript_14406/g.21751 Transcript_14406/m.21751 type:complete len:618 (+) Transcript_14406:110-1963(+)|eukprot:CAMPEP_0197305608 /NCGR_PEP_ID=MMETSP0891-20130614/1816_1 /TAXON_ID=44058 ORGANISM="Aureoumbra lagunensis, Strain CCMP1510" /NCGR_SAMPLE_ID=MMETSP0891 /ASSEMBLY_ACC=CAM_ASM_000534 /LENGTH=617 /DNA_ID=CAMNT_0042786851 /DNA_START=86 /DNA_END=1939 /DNA_ORIENTATION=-
MTAIVFGSLASPTYVKGVVPVGTGYLTLAERRYRKLHGESADFTSTKNNQDNDEEKSVGPKRKVTEAELESLNYYELLGLDSFGVGVDDEMLRRAYHKALLLYHPDKLSGTSSDATKEKKKKKDDQGDAVFLAVQKAFAILSDEQTRRAYDSTNQFDEWIPTGREAEEAEEAGEEFDFYGMYGRVFKSNARFAIQQPVPELGTSASTEKEVEAFYEYWSVRFESWRDFGLEAREHDPEQAEDRYEKRWMIKENEKIAKKRKKEEYARIALLVDRARTNDPRIKKFAHDRAEAKRLTKILKIDAQMAARVAEEAIHFLKQQEAASQAKKDADAAKQRKAARDKLKKAKRRAEKAIWAVISEARSHADFCIDDDCFEALSSILEPEELVALAEQADDSADFQRLLRNALNTKRREPTIRLAFTKDPHTGEHTLHTESSSKADNINKQTKNGTSAEQLSNKMNSVLTVKAPPKPWTEEELSMLAKAIKRFPAGARQRWEMIADHVSSQLRLEIPRTKDECIAKYQELQAAPKRTKAQTEIPKSSAPPVVHTVDENGWTEQQQKQLERGLAMYAASLEANERWKLIAAQVDGKSKKECVERYKQLRKAVQASQVVSSSSKK